MEINDIELLETSPVGIPAYPAAVNKSFKSQVLDKAKITGMEAERKRKGMSPAEFYAAPRDPPSASALPIFDEAHVRNAMARFNQTQFRSADEKAKAKRKIISAAKKFGIDVGAFGENKKEVKVSMETKQEEIKEDKIEEEVEAKEEEKEEVKEVKEVKEEVKEEEEKDDDSDAKEEEEEKAYTMSITKDNFKAIVKETVLEALEEHKLEKKSLVKNEEKFPEKVEKSLGELGEEFIKG